MHPELQALLTERLEIISNHTLRDRDPAAHLEALKNVSENITAYSQIHLKSFDPKLRHYITQSSFQKALEHLKGISPASA